MNKYKNNDLWGALAALAIFLGLFFLFMAVVNLLAAGSLMFQTRVEHEVFENSHQYQEARASELATYEAQMAEIESQLRNPALSDNSRQSLEAQRASLRVRIEAATNR